MLIVRPRRVAETRTAARQIGGGREMRLLVIPDLAVYGNELLNLLALFGRQLTGSG